MKQVYQGLAAVVLLVVVGLGFQAHAQMGTPYGPLNGPISPYININRFGASPAVNYFNIVQPQLQFNAAIDQLGVQQGALGQSMNSMANNPGGMTTGHPVMYGNYLWFYNSRGVGGMGMGGMGGMGMGGMGMGGMGMGGMGMGGMGMGGMGMGGMGMGGMGMGGMGMGGMGMGGMGMGGMGMGGMGMGGMGMGGMGMGGMGMGMMGGR
jgi:hypothetical protein